MSDRNTYSGLSRKEVVCKAYSTTSIEFFDTNPNYFRVQNKGTGRLYCGVSRMPTENNYDFVCDKESSKMYAEPYRRPYLYILNPTGSDISVIVLSFYAEFEPLSLAFSEFKLDLSESVIETTTAIDSFKASLPAGTNNIGKVQVSNWPSDYAKDTNLSSLVTLLNTLLSTTDPDSQYNLASVVENMRKLGKSYAHCKSGTASSGGTTYSANSGAYICEIAFLSNDGAGNLTVTLTEDDGTENSMVIKSGEVLNNIPCTISSIKVTGDSVDYRLMYCERNG